jgi:hypothetical protein
MAGNFPGSRQFEKDTAARRQRPAGHPSSLQQFPFFSSTSFQNDSNSFVFINIVSGTKTDIFSPFVFNNILNLFPRI